MPYTQPQGAPIREAEHIESRVISRKQANTNNWFVPTVFFDVQDTSHLWNEIDRPLAVLRGPRFLSMDISLYMSIAYETQSELRLAG